MGEDVWGEDLSGKESQIGGRIGGVRAQSNPT